MFSKLHLQMTLFCTLITGLIMVALSVTCLFFSESGMKKNGYVSFLNDVHSMTTNLKNQSIISYEWIAKMEKGDTYIVSLHNNGLPVFYENLKNSEKRSKLIEQALVTSAEIYAYSPADSVKSTVITEIYDFSFADDEKQEYYAAVSAIPKTNGQIGITIIYPLRPIRMQILRQRLIFSAFNLVAILLLGVFSYFFTGHMIRPIKENRKRQTQFIASASHELRTPLAVILSSLSAAGKADKTQKEHFYRIVESESQRMSRLIDDLLLLANKDNHTWKLQLEPTELDTLLLNIYEKFKPVANTAEISLLIDLPTDIFPLYSCDPSRIQQVLLILVDNAICYTKKGGTVVLKMDATPNAFMIRITDNGPGVPDAYKEQIFERFFRQEHELQFSVKSYSLKEHFGLGLCIAREIVLLHQGKIWVDDTPLGGATFVVKLPF